MKFTTRKLTTSAVMAALIFVLTITARFPVPMVSGGAYFNLGDTMIYVASYVLGGVPALFAAAIGSALADLAAGAAIYILPTAIIKAAMGAVCGAVTAKRGFKRYLIACIAGGAIMTCGYAIFELVYFDAAYAVASLPFNLLQWGCGSAAGLALYKLADLLRGNFDLRRKAL